MTCTWGAIYDGEMTTLQVESAVDVSCKRAGMTHRLKW